MKCLAEVKDSLDIEVKQNFIDPLQNLCDKDLKEIQVHPQDPLGGPSLLGPCSAHHTRLQREGMHGIGMAPGGPGASCQCDPRLAPSTT